MSAEIYDFKTRRRIAGPEPRRETSAQQSIRALTMKAEHHERLARSYRKLIGEIALRAEEGDDV